MKLIFWENLISHLRTPFHKELVKLHNITLIVDKELSEDRKKLGWKTEKVNNLEVIVKPNDLQIHEIIKANKEACHIVSGIDIYETGTKAIKLLIKENVKFYVGSEQYKSQGLKGSLRLLKSKYQYFKYNNYIKGVFAIGDEAVDWYKKAGYDSETIHQWIYFSEFFDIDLNKSEKDVVLFVGELSDRKNILFLIESFLKISHPNAILRIIGGGEHVDKVKTYAKKHPNIEYLGVVSTFEARQEMSKSKILVLPSIFDGWGAVVNEGLLAGNYCITSNNCGAQLLFKNNPSIGSTFNLGEREDLINVLQHTLDSVGSINANEIKKWAVANLDASKITEYFINVILYHENKIETKPEAPWL